MRRYAAEARHVKVHTSEQVQQLLTALLDEKAVNGKGAAPLIYADKYHEMYAELMLKEKPVLIVRKQTDIIAVSGRTWPLEVFLQSLGFNKVGQEMVVTEAAAEENGGFDQVLEDVNLLAETYGWKVEQR